MPAYSYACECGESFTRYLPMSSCKKKVRCPVCYRAAARDFAAEHGGFIHRPGNWPMKSDAIGVAPKQVAAARAHSLKIGIPTDFTPDGRAILTTAKHRKEYCQALGFYDRNGGYGDPQSGARRNERA